MDPFHRIYEIGCIDEDGDAAVMPEFDNILKCYRTIRTVQMRWNKNCGCGFIDGSSQLFDGRPPQITDLHTAGAAERDEPVIAVTVVTLNENLIGNTVRFWQPFHGESIATCHACSESQNNGPGGTKRDSRGRCTGNTRDNIAGCGQEIGHRGPCAVCDAHCLPDARRRYRTTKAGVNAFRVDYRPD